MSATSPPPASRREVPAAARIVGCCGIAAFFTANLGWLLGGLAQPEAYSSTRDDISDLGALTADEPWLYNQIGANLSGLLMLAFAGALWWALSPDSFGRVGASAVAVAGAGIFLDGIFRLDCRGTQRLLALVRAQGRVRRDGRRVARGAAGSRIRVSPHPRVARSLGAEPCDSPAGRRREPRLLALGRRRGDARCDIRADRMACVRVVVVPAHGTTGCAGGSS
jgi:Protein of unknown function (DUF998)